MSGYQQDRTWSDQMIPDIKRIVGPCLLEPTPLDLDVKEASDLIILRARDMRIAARVRRPGFAEKYPFEFTIRAHRDNGHATELAKIIDGFGDWLFYGHATEDGQIGLWHLIDLHAFRAAMIRHKRSDDVRLCFKFKDNRDGTRFMAYDLRSFPKSPSILVSSSDPIWQMEAA
jgi:hypothetical protein